MRKKYEKSENPDYKKRWVKINFTRNDAPGILEKPRFFVILQEKLFYLNKN